jgi:hypothetical protein
MYWQASNVAIDLILCLTVLVVMCDCADQWCMTEVNKWEALRTQMEDK